MKNKIGCFINTADHSINDNTALVHSILSACANTEKLITPCNLLETEQKYLDNWKALRDGGELITDVYVTTWDILRCNIFEYLSKNGYDIPIEKIELFVTY